jgi:hypothetical protein
VVLSLSCGGSSNNAIDTLDARLATAVCTARVACGLAPEITSCTVGADAFVSPVVIDLVHSGRVHYNEKLGEACIAELGSATCNTADPELRYVLLASSVPVPPAGSNDPCDLMLTGTIGSGFQCEASVECSTAPRLTWLADDRCQFKPGCTPPDCPGECIPQGECGGTCHHDEECAPGLYCSSQSVSCNALLCPGDSCISLTGCQYPSQCGGFLGGQGTCTIVGAPVETGQLCNAADGCAELHDYCSATTMTCTPLAGVGSACGSDVPCVPYATCTAGTCAG